MSRASRGRGRGRRGRCCARDVARSLLDFSTTRRGAARRSSSRALVRLAISSRTRVLRHSEDLCVTQSLFAYDHHGHYPLTAVLSDNELFLVIVRSPVNHNQSLFDMANVSSGSKRAWDGPNDAESHKRPREDGRDRRDAPIGSPRRKPPPGRRDSDDRRSSSDRRSRGGGEHRRRSRDRDYGRRRSPDHSRDRARRDDRDRERDHGRDKSHAPRESGARRDGSRADDRRRDERRRPSPPRDRRTNGASAPYPPPPKVEDEKEEGE